MTRYQFRDPTKGEVLRRLCDDLDNELYPFVWEWRDAKGRSSVLQTTRDGLLDHDSKDAYDIIPVTETPRMTMEAWGVYTDGGALIGAYNSKGEADDYARRWPHCGPTVVRIPPQPIPEEK